MNVHFRFSILLVILLVILTSTSALATIVKTKTTLFVSVHADPGGLGDPLEEARPQGTCGAADPSRVDATIELWLTDSLGNPIIGYPLEDLWLCAPDLCFCGGSNVADANTDANGYTTFSGPLYAGGHAPYGALGVCVNAVTVATIPNLRVTSCDADCNLILQHGPDQTAIQNCGISYPLCADFDNDGCVTAKDASFMAVWIKNYAAISACP